MGGLVAVPNSWPSIAFLVWRYNGIYLLPTGQYVNLTSTTFCAGTLITTRQLLTAASCIPTTVTFTYLGVTYTVQVNTNSNYPTIESMLSVYLGVQNISSIKNDGTFTAPTVKMSVKEARKVNYFIFLHIDYTGYFLLNFLLLFFFK